MVLGDTTLSRVKRAFTERWIDVRQPRETPEKPIQVDRMIPMPLCCWMVGYIGRSHLWCMKDRPVCTLSYTRERSLCLWRLFYLLAEIVSTTNEKSLDWAIVGRSRRWWNPFLPFWTTSWWFVVLSSVKPSLLSLSMRSTKQIRRTSSWPANSEWALCGLEREILWSF